MGKDVTPLSAQGVGRIAGPAFLAPYVFRVISKERRS
jgi:hypothetical protein